MKINVKWAVCLFPSLLFDNKKVYFGCELFKKHLIYPFCFLSPLDKCSICTSYAFNDILSKLLVFISDRGIFIKQLHFNYRKCTVT